MDIGAWWATVHGLLKSWTQLSDYCTHRHDQIFGLRKITVKVRRQPSDWEKIIANEATDKELISKNT